MCRPSLAVAAPLLVREFGGRGLPKEGLGELASLGGLGYAVGKVARAVPGDVVGQAVFLSWAG